MNMNEYTRNELIINVCYTDINCNLTYLDYPLDNTITNDKIEWHGNTAWISPANLGSYIKPDYVIQYGTVCPLGQNARFSIKTCECARKHTRISGDFATSIAKIGIDIDRANVLKDKFVECSMEELATMSIQRARELYSELKVGELLKIQMALSEYGCNICKPLQ